MTGADDPPTQPNTVQSPDNGFMVTKTNPNQGQQYSHSPQAPLPSQECLFNYLTETRILILNKPANLYYIQQINPKDAKSIEK